MTLLENILFEIQIQILNNEKFHEVFRQFTVTLRNRKSKEKALVSGKLQENQRKNVQKKIKKKNKQMKIKEKVCMR